VPLYHSRTAEAVGLAWPSSFATLQLCRSPRLEEGQRPALFWFDLLQKEGVRVSIIMRQQDADSSKIPNIPLLVFSSARTWIFNPLEAQVPGVPLEAEFQN
jgi:hypothetical protein